MNCVGKSLISTCTIFSKCEWMMFIKMTADIKFLCYVQDVVVLQQTWLHRV